MALKIGKALKWLVQRAKEPSTYIGIATVAVIVGKPELANTIGQIGQAVGLIVGGGLMAYPANTPSQTSP